MHLDGAGHALATAPPGWRERVPVLAYGSNACPSKITWLRTQLGLTGPVVAVRVRCTGLVAVWAAGLRARDGQRPATLTALPGVVEHHFVWFATEEQRAILDVCEGRGNRYHLARLDNADIRTTDTQLNDADIGTMDRTPPNTTSTHTPDDARPGTADIRTPDGTPLDTTDIHTPDGTPLDTTDIHTPDGTPLDTTDGTRLDGVLAYVAASPIRCPLLVDGRPVRVADVPQAEAARLTGEPAPEHGLACTVLTPARTFR
ncbi:hypothetical protein GCM10022222_83570 [Amycolatopsis ultiminotia]|uniref:Gamma-glutamylcyclotransferase n=1 Tax=Amycolatopsis ultiminotia TaxID=543629 RepID=A0ABP6YLP8_9PSEU